MCFMRADVFGIRAFLFWSDRSRCNQWRCVRIATANYQINEEIRDKEVRVIGADGAQLGIMSSAAALEIAIEKDLDLVKIAPGSNPPVCKIMGLEIYRQVFMFWMKDRYRLPAVERFTGTSGRFSAWC